MLASKAKWNFIQDEYEQRNMKESNIVDILLQQRGIVTDEEVAKFIAPSIEDLLSPDQLHMIELASKRIHEAILNEEKIWIYGDYDADGVCSTALLLKVLQEAGAICDFYIPNRFTEGYGPNKQAFQKAFENNVQVIITVDTGIASHKEIDFANELGIDVIITDHHDIQDSVPNAYATIHPAHSPQYEFKQLAGVGVAFKLAEHVLGYFPEHLLDLVAIGTIADLVPLIHENRIFATYGLQVLSHTKNKGLIALKRTCKVEGTVTEEDVGFRIAPRLNAVGRLQDADLAVELLMTTNDEEARLLAEEIQALNEQRQQIVRELVKEAEAEIDQVPEKSMIIVAKPNWNEGVLGIVASRLVQKYHCPAIVLSINEETNEAKGSARSIPAFHLFDSCMKIRHLFTAFGGHSQAAGMTLPLENLDVIKQTLNEMVRELDDDDFRQTIEISKTLTLSELDEQLIDQLSRLAPFGIGNPKPIFHVKETPQQLRQIGREKNHLKIQFEHEQNKVEGIGFGLGDQYMQIAPQAKLSIVGELGINEWNGFRTVQVIIQDMKVEEWQLFDHRGKKDFNPTPYIQTESDCILLYNNNQIDYDDEHTNRITQITFRTDINKVPRAKQLFICELPEELHTLEQLIKAIQPEQIHACYYIKESAYLQSFPSRDDFKWLYALVIKQKTLHIKQDIPKIMKYKGWSKDRVIFMLHVFNQLQFIEASNGMINATLEPAKKDLHESQVYQERQKQAEIEKILYYSNYDQLRTIFSQWIDHRLKEEVSYGL